MPRRGAEAGLVVLHRRDDAIAVELGLEEPVRVGKRPLRQRGQHGRQHARRVAFARATYAWLASALRSGAVVGRRPSLRSSIVRPERTDAILLEDVVLRVGEAVVLFDEQPVLVFGVHQRPAAVQLVALQEDRRACPARCLCAQARSARSRSKQGSPSLLGCVNAARPRR